VKLTPLDIRKQTFRHKTMRGFDPEEVRIFLDMAADEYEKLLQENGMLSEKVRYLSERLDEYHNLEKTLQASILTAERAAAESRERSRIEAQTIINDAHVRSERILDDARSRLRQLSEQLQQLSAEKDLFLQRFHALLDGHAKFLASQQADLDAIDALDARARSLIANGPARSIVGPGPAFDEDRDEEGEAEDEERPRPEGLDYRTDQDQEHALRQEQESYPASFFDREESERESPADPPKRRFTEPALGRPAPPASGPAFQRHEGRRGPGRGAFAPEAPEDGEADGFHPPVERAEGFFELNARPNSEGGGQR
jgi:cell division initiation protein